MSQIPGDALDRLRAICLGYRVSEKLGDLVAVYPGPWFTLIDDDRVWSDERLGSRSHLPRLTGKQVSEGHACAPTDTEQGCQFGPYAR